MKLIGVIHCPPLPGSPRAESLERTVVGVERDAKALVEAGFDLVMIENYGDAPFFAERVPPVTIAAMTACALAAKRAGAKLGVNVLRNDAESALSIAACVGASCIRVNVHTGARVTDQGLVQGRAAETLRLRDSLRQTQIGIWADVNVKHSAPLGVRPLEDEVSDAVERGLADAVLVTGRGTGQSVDVEALKTVKRISKVPVYAASGVTHETVREILGVCDGVIVGSALRADGRAGGPIDPRRAADLVTRAQ